MKMTSTTTAPDLSPGYPSKGAKIGPAWSAVWAEMSKSPTEWRLGRVLWVDIAPRFGLSPETMRALMYRMVKGGILDAELRKVEGSDTLRKFAHFRITNKEG